MTRNLAGLVSPNHIISNSDYMQSVLFVIPESEESTWMNEYETLLPMELFLAQHVNCIAMMDTFCTLLL